MFQQVFSRNRKGSNRGQSVKMILLTIIISMFTGAAFSKEDSRLDDKPFRFDIRIKWDKKWSRTSDKGHLNASIRGKLKFEDKEESDIGEHRIYSVSNSISGYNYFFRTKMDDISDKCAGKTTKLDKGGGIFYPEVVFQSMTSKLGWWHFEQYKQTITGIDINSLIDLAMNPKSDKVLDTYTFMITPPLLKTHEHYMCPKDWSEDSFTGFAFFNHCGKLNPENNSAIYQWKGEAQWGDGTKPDEEIKVGDCLNIKKLSPANGKDTNYKIRWQFGKIDPIVEIWYQDIDITDEKQDILIGRKVTLTARVFPDGNKIEGVTWKIDGFTVGDKEPIIVAGYEAAMDHGMVKPITPDDLEQEKLKFFWVKGEEKGKAHRIICSATINGKEKKAETTFQVYIPKFDKSNCIRKITKHITIGDYPKCKYDQIPNKPNKLKWSKFVYLGKFSKIQNLPESVCSKKKDDFKPADDTSWQDNCESPEIDPNATKVQGDVGIVLKHKIIMPPLEDETNLVQYIQIVKEINLEYNGIKYMRTKNRLNWIFDSKSENKYVNYLNKKPCPYKRSMNDTPGQELGNKLEKVYQYQQFRTYLMFKPSEKIDDPDTIWVPLEKVDWAWMYGVELSRDKQYYKLIEKKVIPGKGKLNPILLPSHPEWHGYASDPEYYMHEYKLTEDQFNSAIKNMRNNVK